jgi:hypothetical protein
MRSAFLVLFAVMVVVSSYSETIVLKNGRKILVDSVKEDGNKVHYEIGEDSFAIPKSAVDHIESYGSAAAARASEVPDVIPQTSAPEFATSAPVNVIKNDRVDDVAVAAAEQSGDPTTAAVANFRAGKFSLEQGDRDAAARYFDRALRFQPNNGAILTSYASVLVRISRPEDAVPIAERAVRASPESADAWAVLGYAELQSDHAKEAVPAFEKSLKLRPDASIQAFLARAQRESSTSNYLAAESSHFSLRFEGSAAGGRLPKDILEELDSDYDHLVSELGYAPHASIPVVLYPDREYFDVTQAPAWSAAINDGKLQVPIRGLTQINGELARVLRHELTHSFVNQITRGRCPLWLNEGVAQLMEPRSAGSAGSLLARLFITHHEVPLNLLETSFINLNTNEAAIAYAESIAAVEYIDDTYGMSDVRSILERIGQGASVESALRATLNVGYQQFEEDIGTFLKSKYGD